MTLGITLLLLFAALTHASWNAIVKGARDPVAMATWVYVGSGLLLAPLMLLLPPLPPKGWILVGIHFVLHVFYKLAMLQMYRLGDLSQVYPVARGLSPLLVTLIAIPVAGEFPSVVATMGIVVVCAGLMVFALEPGALSRARIAPLLIALAAGVIASTYTVVDGLGVRLAGYGLSYFVTLFVVDGASMAVIALAWRRRALLPLLVASWRRGLPCAVLSIVNFGIVLWVISFTAMGPVAAVRETSVVFAAVIGAVLMGEAFGVRRIAGAATIAAGIALINWPA